MIEFESAEAAANQITLLMERVAELEFQQEDIGWTRIDGGSNDYELSRDHLRKVVARARLFFLHNPLIRRAVSLQADYVFAQGVNIQATDPDVNQVIQDFLDDTGNIRELFGHKARLLKEQTLQLDGNIFLVLFTNKDSGQVSVRSVLVDEIVDIITNPDDGNETWYYKRQWSARNIDTFETETRTEYYPDVNYLPVTRPPKIKEDKINWDYPIYHVKVGELSKSKFGVPEVYPALDWAQAFRNFLRDWATIVRAYARFAFKVTTPGGKESIAAVKTKLGTSITSADAAERNPVPVTGSLFTRSKDGTDIEPIKTAGATTSARDGREIRMMVAAALGIPDCYDSETEVLTEQGFMRHDEWKPGIKVACYNPDTEFIEWHEPEELRQFYYNGDMIQFKHQQVDILVTPHHRMWTAPAVQWNLQPAGITSKVGRRSVADGGKAQISRDWRIETAQHILDNPRSYGWKLTNKIRFAEDEYEHVVATPLGVVDAYSWARFIGYWISEGHASINTQSRDKETLQYRIGVSQREGKVFDDIKETLDELGIKYGIWTHNVSGVKVFGWHDRNLWNWLRDNCGANSHDKRLPKEVFNIDESLTWSEDMRHALFIALMQGDGGRSGRYSTVSKRLADDMQLLAISLGYGASITSDFTNYKGEKYECYRVWIRTRSTDVSLIKPKHVAKVPYSGKIYCFRLKYGLYVTRRMGKIAINGNTFFGDVDVGNLATARTLDRPTELKFRSRQQFWMDVITDILNYVVKWAVIANKGPLKGNAEFDVDKKTGKLITKLTRENQTIDTHIEVMFPPILEHSVIDRINAVTEAVTLNGKALAFDSPELTKLTFRLMFQALGLKDTDELIKGIFDNEQVNLNPQQQGTNSPQQGSGNNGVSNPPSSGSQPTTLG